MFTFRAPPILLILLLIKSFEGSVIENETGRPVLSGDRLHEIRIYDRMTCFPKILCTLTKTGAFAKLGSVSLNDIADGYLRLLTAFPGGPPSDTVSQNEDSIVRFKDDLASFIYGGEKDTSKSNKNRGDNDDDEEKEESEELLLSDPILHQKEKLEMKKLMEELMTEEKAEAAKEQDSWTKSAITLPLKIGGTLLSKLVLPYFLGDRRKRDVTEDENNAYKDPLESAMKWWNKLDTPQQCAKLYPTCPFQAWEVVSMIKLIRDGNPKSS